MIPMYVSLHVNVSYNDTMFVSLHVNISYNDTHVCGFARQYFL